MSTDFAHYLQQFLTAHLAGLRNLSTNTIASYRDTFKLLLRYFRDHRSIPPEKLTLDCIDPEAITGFLDWLETTRKNSTATRNLRLAAISSFYTWMQTQDPSRIASSQLILAIPAKRQSYTSVVHLTVEQTRILLAAPDRTTTRGRRDATLLATLYDTAVRVQELADLRVGDLRLEPPAMVTVTGKGNKIRGVPLMDNAVALLRSYLTEHHLHHNGRQDHPVFFNQYRTKLSRGGIAWILRKYQASLEATTQTKIDLSPHVLRHSKAIHLFDSGVPLPYIRDILGHVDLSTTEIYARVSTHAKRTALEAAYPDIITTDQPEWNQDPKLLDWLNSL